MMDIILLLLAVVGLCSAYCLPGIRRVRDRQTDENITAAEDIWDCFWKAEENSLHQRYKLALAKNFKIIFHCQPTYNGN